MCAEVCFWGVEGPGGRDTVLCAGLMEGMTEGEKRVELERGGFLVQRLVERLDAVCRGREEVLKKVKMECMKARKESKTVAGEDPVGDLVRRLEEEEAALV